jgi:hypothetical protein
MVRTWRTVSHKSSHLSHKSSHLSHKSSHLSEIKTHTPRGQPIDKLVQ